MSHALAAGAMTVIFSSNKDLEKAIDNYKNDVPGLRGW